MLLVQPVRGVSKRTYCLPTVVAIHEGPERRLTRRPGLTHCLIGHGLGPDKYDSQKHAYRAYAILKRPPGLFSLRAQGVHEGGVSAFQRTVPTNWRARQAVVCRQVHEAPLTGWGTRRLLPGLR